MGIILGAFGKIQKIKRNLVINLLINKINFRNKEDRIIIAIQFRKNLHLILFKTVENSMIEQNTKSDFHFICLIIHQFIKLK